MMTEYRAELHLHTVLSPCAEVEMIPPLIIEKAVEMGIQLLAVTDHNSTRNVAAVIQAAEGTGIHVLPGMELQTREEVHLLCLFDTMDQARQWQAIVDETLPQIDNDEDHFGPQYIVDSTGDYIKSESQMLAVSSDMTLDEAIDKTHLLGGLAIPSHVDRPSYSLLANLGFIPPGFKADALEVYRKFSPNPGYDLYPDLKNWPLLVNGDCHMLHQIEGRMSYMIESPGIEEIRKALRNEDGRKVILPWTTNP